MERTISHYKLYVCRLAIANRLSLVYARARLMIELGALHFFLSLVTDSSAKY